MPEEAVSFIMEYGYAAIFILIFIQEIGMPNPLPNEILLMFSGYLSFKGMFILPLLILTATAADFSGTNVLFFTFYAAGRFLIQKKPMWFPISQKKLERIARKINNGGNLSILLFRLTPFTRGYTSVITGALRIRPRIFLPIALFSASIWATVYVVAGYMIGPSWNIFSHNTMKFKYLMLIFMVTILSFVVFRYFRGKNKDCPDEPGVNNNGHKTELL